MATPPLIEAADCAFQTGAGTPWPDIDYNAYALGDLVVFHISSDRRSVTHGVLPDGPNGETITILANSANIGGSSDPTISVWYFIGSATTPAGSLTVTSSGTESVASCSFVLPAGEFDSGNPIEAFDTAGNTVDSSTISSPALTGITADGTVVAFLGIDSDVITGSPSGWTDLGTADEGSIIGHLAVRDAATTVSEAIAAADWTVSGDTATTAGYVVNAPTGGGSTTPKSLSYTAVHTALLSSVVTFHHSANMTANHSSSIVKLIKKGLSFSHLANSNIVKKISKTLGYSATHTATQQEGLVVEQSASMSASHTLSAATNFILGGISSFIRRVAIKIGIGL